VLVIAGVVLHCPPSTLVSNANTEAGEMVLVEIDSAFGTAYWSSHRRLLLRSRPWLVNDSVHTAAQALAQKGFLDVPIMIGR
jgi:hypothetical protein